MAGFVNLVQNPSFGRNGRSAAYTGPNGREGQTGPQTQLIWTQRLPSGHKTIGLGRRTLSQVVAGLANDHLRCTFKYLNHFQSLATDAGSQKNRGKFNFKIEKTCIFGKLRKISPTVPYLGHKK